MIIDWTTILVTFVGTLTFGGTGFFIFYRANKSGATADALTKSAEAMEKVLTNMDKQQELFNSIIGEKNISIINYEQNLSANNKLMSEQSVKISEQSYKIAELERKSAGNSREIGQLKKAFSEVENIACLKLACKIRQPELGTYKHKIAE